MISLIAAMAKNRVIGQSNQMPWHLPADLARFKAITIGKTIIMGRKTFASIGKPLPGRRNIVITRGNLTNEGCEFVHSLEEALDIAGDEQEVFVIGGGDIFQQALPRATRLYLTLIDLEVEGDTFFPDWDEQQWQLVSEVAHPQDEKTPYPYRFLLLERVIF